jgi:DNA-binding beta-propeller fold protein YncE
MGDSYTETQLVFVGLNAGGLTGLAFAPDGTLWGTDNRNKRLLTIDVDTGALTTIAQLPWGSYIGLAFSPNGTIFTTDDITDSILQFAVNGNKLWEGPYVSDTPILGIEFPR